MDTHQHINTLEEACAKTGDDIANVKITLPGRLKRFEQNLQAELELLIMTEAENDAVEPNYLDGSEKFEPVYEVLAKKNNPSGSGLRFNVYVYISSHTHVGTRLSFRKRESVIHVGKSPEWLKRYEQKFAYHKLEE